MIEIIYLKRVYKIGNRWKYSQAMFAADEITKKTKNTITAVAHIPEFAGIPAETIRETIQRDDILSIETK